MFESLVSTFEALHPISVVNHLHSQSVDRVESRNTLKKEKSLDLQVGLVNDSGTGWIIGSKDPHPATRIQTRASVHRLTVARKKLFQGLAVTQYKAAESYGTKELFYYSR